MNTDEDCESSNIVHPKQFQSEIRIEQRTEARLNSNSNLSPARGFNRAAVTVFCILGVVALLLSALEPSKGHEMTWSSGFLLLSGALCFGIAAIFRFSKDFRN